MNFKQQYMFNITAGLSLTTGTGIYHAASGCRAAGRTMTRRASGDRSAVAAGRVDGASCRRRTSQRQIAGRGSRRARHAATTSVAAVAADGPRGCRRRAAARSYKIKRRRSIAGRAT